MHTYNIVEQGAPLEKAKKALILIHGRGASAHDILGLAPYFAQESWYVAAPQATNHTWYPYSFMVPAAQNEPWLSSAIEVVHTLAKTILEKLAAENLYMMGFSQGACLTAEFSARLARRYGGVGIFTGGLIGAQPDYSLYSGDFGGTPVYISNGDNDPHVPLSRSEETLAQFEKMGARAKMEIFPNRPHTITQQELIRMATMIPATHA